MGTKTSLKKRKEEIEQAEKDSFELALFKDLPFLNEDKLKALNEIKSDLIDGFKKREWGRPKYLMEVSVLKDMKFPTPDAKYWQCILERDVQFQNLLFSALDFKEKMAEIEEKDAEIDTLMKNNHDRLALAKIKRLEVQKQRLMLQLALMRKEAEERVREIMDWTALIKEVETKLKYSKDNPEEHMPESFLIRFAAQKQIIDQLGAADMNGAMNIIGLGQSAKRYWEERKRRK